MTYEILLAGFGGQGIMLMGTLLAYAGMIEGKRVSWIPSYGPEMRGGTANCSVVVSDEEVACPIVTEPSVLVAMNEPSLKKFYESVARPGDIFVNTSIVDIDCPALRELAGNDLVDAETIDSQAVTGNHIRVFGIEANGIAEELGNRRVANMVVLGAVQEITGAVKLASLESALEKAISKRHRSLIKINIEALNAGAKWAQTYLAARQPHVRMVTS
jgi:2-oxoglutarate ferredoxin oxidoreductase subunit gamma